MKYLALFFAFVCGSISASFAADAPTNDRLAKVTTQTDLDAVIAATGDAKLKDAMKTHAADILRAAARRPHVERVIKVLEPARGTFERMNDTPEALHAALGGPSTLFDALKSVNLADAGLGVKAKREVDPFDQAFYDNVSRLVGLEDLIVMHTVAQNDWIAPLGKLTSLKSLRFINQAKLTDDGLRHFAGLKQLERFSFIGTQITGEPFREFRGWTNLKASSYRGSRMSDAGLIALCEAFPTLETLVLAHGQFTDTAVAHVAKLTKLTGLEIGSPKATPQCLKHLVGLKLEYLQLGDGLDASAGIAIIPQIKSLKRLTLTNVRNATEADLKTVATMRHLDHLELSFLTDERLPLLKEFAFLKSLRLVRGRDGFTDEAKAKIKADLPTTEIKFE